MALCRHSCAGLFPTSQPCAGFGVTRRSFNASGSERVEQAAISTYYDKMIEYISSGSRLVERNHHNSRIPKTEIYTSDRGDNHEQDSRS